MNFARVPPRTSCKAQTSQWEDTAETQTTILPSTSCLPTNLNKYMTIPWNYTGCLTPKPSFAKCLEIITKFSQSLQGGKQTVCHASSHRVPQFITLVRCQPPRNLTPAAPGSAPTMPHHSKPALPGTPELRSDWQGGERAAPHQASSHSAIQM